MKLSSFIIAGLVSSSFAAELVIPISGIEPKQDGKLLVFLYKESNWMKLKEPSKTVVVTENLRSVSIKLASIPEGEYAIQVVHDRDLNGKLTMKWTPPGPTEGYGFTAGYKPSAIPKYAPAKFSLGGNSSMPIVLIYPK